MPFFSLSISANILLLETKAISMPEKKALKTIVTRISIISDISTVCSKIVALELYCYDTAIYYDCPLKGISLLSHAN